MTDSRATLTDRARALLPTPKTAGEAYRQELRELAMPPNGREMRTFDRSDPKYARGRAKGARMWTAITGITWHQTATADFGEHHPGLPSVPAHMMLHRDGTCTVLHPLTAVIWHGHALNSFTVGIEIACRAAGTEGDPSTFWRSQHEKDLGRTMETLRNEANMAQLAMVGPLMLWVHDQIIRNGGIMRSNWAHRQGHKSRTSDPGSRIWKAVKSAELASLLPWEDAQDRKVGSGKTIPKEWRL